MLVRFAEIFKGKTLPRRQIDLCDEVARPDFLASRSRGGLHVEPTLTGGFQRREHRHSVLQIRESLLTREWSLSGIAIRSEVLDQARVGGRVGMDEPIDAPRLSDRPSIKVRVLDAREPTARRLSVVFRCA